MKLSQGEYISIPKLTQIFEEIDLISQIYIHCGLKNRFPVAIVVLNDSLPQSKLISEFERLNLLDNKANEYSLNGFEKIKAIHLTFEQFTIDSGTITPSLKLASYQIEKNYQSILDNLDMAAQ